MLVVARWQRSPSGPRGHASVPTRWFIPIAPTTVGGCLATCRDGLSATRSHCIPAQTPQARPARPGEAGAAVRLLLPRAAATGGGVKPCVTMPPPSIFESGGLGTHGAFSALGELASLSVSVQGRHSAFMRRAHTTEKTGTFNVPTQTYPNSRYTERNSWRSLDRHQQGASDTPPPEEFDAPACEAR
jgi:hypothetical protein